MRFASSADSILLLFVAAPIFGAIALGFAGLVWQAAMAPATPRWQSYLYFLAAGLVLMKLPEMMGAVR